MSESSESSIMSESSESSINSEMFDLQGFVEEGDLVINIQKINYAEELKEYTDEKICNELKDLIKLDFNVFFGKMSYYDQYFQNILTILRNEMEHPYIACDESIYPLIEKNIFPLLFVEPVKVADVVKANENEEILWEYLQERQFLIASSESLFVSEARSIEHARTFKIPADVDPKWLTKFNNDTDVMIINENDQIIEPLRVIGPTFLNPQSGKKMIDEGDVFVFRGFVYYGKIDGTRDDMHTFNVDEYFNNINSLRDDDNVTVYFNVGEVIDGSTQIVSKGVVEKIHKYIIHIRIGSRLFDFSTVDLSVNNCFVYGSSYEGESYSKRMLFNSNWVFVLDEDPMSPVTLKNIFFPNVREGANIFPEIDNLKNFNDVKTLFGEFPYGKESGIAITDKIKNKIKSEKKYKPPPIEKGNVQSNSISNVNVLMFQNNKKIFSKYFDKYILNDTYVDGDMSRFNHLSNNKHMMYAYALNIMLKRYPSKFTKIHRTENTKKTYKHTNIISDTDFVFDDTYNMMIEANVENDKTALVQKSNRLYTMTKGYWRKGDDNDKYAVFPRNEYGVNMKYLDHLNIVNNERESNRIIKDVSTNIETYHQELRNDINKQLLLGKYVSNGNILRECNYVNTIDYTKMIGDDEEVDELVEVPENMNTYEMMDTTNEVIIDEDISNIFEEPVGIVVKLFIDLFSITIDVSSLRILLYKISKYNDFQKLKEVLNEKERALRVQVQIMKNKNQSIDKAKLEEMTKKRLTAVENEYMSEYYAKTITMVIAFFVLYIQMNIPTINIKPISIEACNNTFSYLGYPFDDNPKSLIKYFVCIVSKLSAVSGPFKLAKERLSKTNIEAEVVKHIDNVIEQKSHYKEFLEDAKNSMDASKKRKNEHFENFYGFRPNLKTIQDTFSLVKADDLIMNRQAHPHVNSCCISEIDELVSNKIVKRKNISIVKSIKFVMPPQTSIMDVTIPPIKQINHHIITGQVELGDTHLSTFQNFITLFCESNDLFRNDEILRNIIKDFNDSAWNDMSCLVTMKWQQLIKSLKSNEEQKNIWHEVFIHQEDRYRDPHVVKIIFEKIARTVLPTILGRGVNNYKVDSRHIESKTFIPSKDRDAIINYLIDKETMHLINLLRENKDAATVSTVLNRSFANIHTKFVHDTESIYKVILFYNYVILKVLLGITGVEIGEYTMRLNSMDGFVTLLMTKICHIMDVNYIDIDELNVEYEKQRENVKQELMRKMERMSQEDRNIFRTVKDKTGLDLDYMDKIQNRAKDIMDLMKNNDIDVDGAILVEDPDTIPMTWVGEDPDDGELEDDGSGY